MELAVAVTMSTLVKIPLSEFSGSQVPPRPPQLALNSAASQMRFLASTLSPNR